MKMYILILFTNILNQIVDYSNINKAEALDSSPSLKIVNRNIGRLCFIGAVNVAAKLLA